MARSNTHSQNMSMLDQSDPDLVDGDYYSGGPSDDEWMEEVPRDLSVEDETQLLSATDELCRRLGADADGYLTEQIREALWNFYYDIDETVAYLKRLRKFTHHKASPNLITESRGKNLSGKLSSILKPNSEKRACAMSDHTSFRSTRSSIGVFFADMPWQNIPECRRTVFVSPPRPKGGLLGGAPKVSKLQALAAARKKKAEEKKAGENAGGDAVEVSLVTGLSKADTQERGSPGQVAATAEDHPLKDVVPGAAQDICQPREAIPASSLDLNLETVSEPYRAQPSAFAQALFLKSASEIQPRPAFQRIYQMPGMQYVSPEALRDAFNQPSPDDLVIAAQSQDKKKIKQAGKGPATNTKDVAKKMELLKIAEVPLPRSKNINVLKEFAKAEGKKSVSFVVCGHVDSGKSTMLGRLMVDMGIVDQRTVEKYRKEAARIGKESFSLAWMFDTRSDERQNGVTIDINTRQFATATTEFTLIDSPGHADFIPNMLAGASLADCAILVVDAAKGAFEAGFKGQMREHALLLRSMGVFRLIVAVNKLDTCDWDEGRFDTIRLQVQGAMNALRFNTKDVCFIPVTAIKGANITAPSLDPKAQWYKGATLLEELERSEPLVTDEQRKKPLRMTITGVRENPTSSVCVEGRVEAGSLQVGDPVLVEPCSQKGYIKGIEVRDNPVEWAVAGQFVVLHLSHIDEEYIDAGHMICALNHPIDCVDHFTMIALAFEPLIPDMGELHRGRMKAAARISKLEATLNIRDGTVLKKKPQLIKAGQTARIQVKIQDYIGKVPLEKGQRVVFRASGQTLAAGLIE